MQNSHPTKHPQCLHRKYCLEQFNVVKVKRKQNVHKIESDLEVDLQHSHTSKIVTFTQPDNG